MHTPHDLGKDTLHAREKAATGRRKTVVHDAVRYSLGKHSHPHASHRMRIDPHSLVAHYNDQKEQKKGVKSSQSRFIIWLADCRSTFLILRKGKMSKEPYPNAPPTSAYGAPPPSYGASSSSAPGYGSPPPGAYPPQVRSQQEPIHSHDYSHTNHNELQFDCVLVLVPIVLCPCLRVNLHVR